MGDPNDFIPVHSAEVQPTAPLFAPEEGYSARTDIFPISTRRCMIPFSMHPSQNGPQMVAIDFLQCKSKDISLDYRIQSNIP